MRRTLLFALLCAGMLFTGNAKSQDAQKPAPAAEGLLSGHWIITAEYLGTPVNLSMEFKQDGNKLTGNFDGDKLEGTVTGNSVHFLAKDDQGGSEEGTATVQGDAMSGTIIYIDGSNPTHPMNTPFTAKLAGKSPARAPQTHEFTPTVFYREFSPTNKPVLTVNPGDTIHTTTVDAGGTDEKGVPRVMGGNPETGPFYIESAATRRHPSRSSRALAPESRLGDERRLHRRPRCRQRSRRQNEGRRQDHPLASGHGARRCHSRKARRAPDALFHSAETDDGLHRGRARADSRASADRRFGQLGRQHGFQRNRRRRHGLSSGQRSRRASLCRRWTCGPGRRRVER